MNYPVSPVTGSQDAPIDMPPVRSPLSRQGLRYRFHVGLVVADASALLFSFWLAGMLRTTPAHGGNANLGLLLVPMLLILALNNGSYSYQSLANWRHGLGRVVTATTQALALMLLLAFSLQSSEQFSRLVFGAGAVLTYASLTFGRWAMHRRTRRWHHDLLGRLVITDRCTVSLPAGIEVVDADAAGLRPDPRDPMMLNRLGQMVRGADFVLVCCQPEDRAGWAHLLKGTDVTSHVLVPEFDELGGTVMSRFHGHRTLQVSTGAMELRERFQKRVRDLALTVPAIVLLAGVMILVAVAIKLDTRGPVLFRQERLGRGNRLFKLVKFRSMHLRDCDARGDTSTARGDTRVTRVGRIIRATSLDELPQLFNVLWGDMSLVGPRPHALGSLAGLDLFWDVDQRYWHRHALKPGITGLAQVRGFRGATLRRDDLINRLQADLEYFEGWSLWRDIRILFATVRVLVHRNAY
jgi:lipopolysaccharide/colanic/teichoic acid biosynthesis glycosyltransferase